MDTNLIEENLVSGCDQLREGQIVMYEGEKAEVIGVKPLLIIKVKDRVVCGALHVRVLPVEELQDSKEIHSWL